MKKKNRMIMGILLTLVLVLSGIPHGIGRIQPVSAAETGKCGDNLTWTLNNGKLTIDGTGNMYDYAGGGAPWFSESDSIKYVEIKDGATSIGSNAFGFCTRLFNVTIPDSVTSIGDCAFDGCQDLNEITIPDNVTSIGNSAFASCMGLRSITIGKNVSEIGPYAFFLCKFESVTIPASVMTIGEGAFADCSRLASITVEGDNPKYSSEDGILYDKSKTKLIQYPSEHSGNSMTIPDSVTTIGDNAFDGSDDLLSVEIPDSVKTIGGYAFSGCSSLQSVEIPDSVTAIGKFAFSQCHALTNVNIGSGVKEIGDGAFLYCESLKDIFVDNIEGNVTVGNNWNNNATVHWKHTVETVASPETDGTVEIATASGSGPYWDIDPESHEPTVITLTVNPKKGFYCSELTGIWTDKDGQQQTAKLSKNPEKPNEYSFEMPNADITVTAKFELITYHSVTVVNGEADKKTAAKGEKVTIKADVPKLGEAFRGWTTDGLGPTELGDPKKSEAEFTMPGNDVKVTATYCDVLIYTGSGPGISEQVYTGEQIIPENLFVALDGVDDFEMTPLFEEDYTLAFVENTNVGTASVNAALKNSYVGSGSATFEIVPASFEDAMVEVAAEKCVYDGTEQKPTPEVVWHEKQVGEEDFTAKYSDNVRAGKATVTVTGRHNFKDDAVKTATFEIEARPLTITADSADKAYDSKPLTADGFTSEGLAEGDRVASVKVEGSQIEVGSSANKVSGAKIVNAAGEDVTDCYAITYQPGTLTVKAVETFTLTFDLGGGTLNGKTGTYTIECEKGETIHLPDAPTKEGFRFLYWKGSRYEAGAEYTVTGPHDFTAVWEKAETSPKTGDNNHMILWVVLMATALAVGISIVIVTRRKLKKNR